MAARDIYHPVVVRALQKQGWRITHDPLVIPVGRKKLLVDLGAEQIIAAERENKRIAVEIKSFQGESDVNDLEKALGQYLLYRPFLQAREPDRPLYLAIPKEIYDSLFEEPLGRGVLAEYSLRLTLFDLTTEEITRWIPEP